MSDKPTRVLDNIKEIRALNDPYRQEILRQLFLLNKPSTAKEIATAMGEPPSKVNYHIKVLEQYDFVKLDHTKNINGIIAKYYAYVDNELELKVSKEEKDGRTENEIINMLDSLYSKAKSTYMNKLKQVLVNDCIPEDQDRGYIISTKMYLNKEEKEEIKEIIGKLRKFSKNSKEDREVFDFFASLI